MIIIRLEKLQYEKLHTLPVRVINPTQGRMNLPNWMNFQRISERGHGVWGIIPIGNHLESFIPDLPKKLFQMQIFSVIKGNFGYEFPQKFVTRFPDRGGVKGHFENLHKFIHFGRYRLPSENTSLKVVKRAQQSF